MARWLRSSFDSIMLRPFALTHAPTHAGAGYWNGALVAVKVLEQIAGDFNPRTTLEPLLRAWKQEAGPRTSLGDWVNKQGDGRVKSLLVQP
jgi:hypothetical protein